MWVRFMLVGDGPGDRAKRAEERERGGAANIAKRGPPEKRERKDREGGKKNQRAEVGGIAGKHFPGTVPLSSLIHRKRRSLVGREGDSHFQLLTVVA